MWLKCGKGGEPYTGSATLKARVRLDIAGRSMLRNLHSLEVDNEPAAAI
jgi:hypothetical protein